MTASFSLSMYPRNRCACVDMSDDVGSTRLSKNLGYDSSYYSSFYNSEDKQQVSAFVPDNLADYLVNLTGGEIVKTDNLVAQDQMLYRLMIFPLDMFADAEVARWKTSHQWN